MKRFRFSLEAVATVRRHEEQLALDRFSRDSLNHRLALEKLAVLQKELDAHLDIRRPPPEDKALGFARLHAWQESLEMRVKQQTQQVATTLRVLNESSRLLQAARQRREAVEKVRESRRTLHESELRRLEQKALDELVHRRSLAQGLLNETGDGIVGLSP